jgi:hypothetical protein
MEDESLGVPIQRIEGVPAHRHFKLVCHIYQQRRLAIACRSGDDHQFAVQVVKKELQESLAGQEVRSATWQEDFGACDLVKKIHHASSQTPDFLA